LVLLFVPSSDGLALLAFSLPALFSFQGASRLAQLCCFAALAAFLLTVSGERLDILSQSPGLCQQLFYICFHIPTELI
ncbi:MAG: hypothetical protein E6X17_11430, partial [Sporomusaceae bacterium]|nr:hypothetical protein [Sporomusaceae bacterium]